MPESPTDAVPTVPARHTTPHPRRRSLLVVNGDDITSRPLPVVGRLSVGRAPTSDVQIQHPSISRNHLVLQLDADGIEIVDQGGANGTTLRGVRLPSAVPVAIAANEAFQVGDLTLVVQDLVAPAPGGPAERRPSGTVPARRAEPLILDPRMRRLYELAARLARGSLGLLLIGETGTGKEVLADFVHHASPRASGPLVRINCAAFADSLVESELFGHEKGAFTGAQRDRRGLIEVADGGTVLFDEIGEMPLGMQAKLLRVIEDLSVLRVGGSRPVEVDVRFLAATNRDLEAEVEAGRFRRDLYYRLAGAVLAIPPLRERTDEVVALAQAFAAAAAARLGRPVPTFGDEVVAALRRHTWPGNLRELRNAMERAVLLVDGDRITVAELAFERDAAPAPVGPAPAAETADASIAETLAAHERQRILEALAACNGNQTRAAAQLGMPLRTLVKRLGQYGLARPRKP